MFLPKTGEEILENKILGIHHITALASEPQKNYNFYTKILGLRMVKKTVNFDAPDVYHLYYGDKKGTPGTNLTFFPFPDATRGKRGVGEINKIIFRIPANSLEYWIDRITSFNISFSMTHRNVERGIEFLDPDGMLLELRENEDSVSLEYWEDSPVPQKYFISNFLGVKILIQNREKTSKVLTDLLGFESEKSESGNIFTVETDQGIQIIELEERNDLPNARISAGSVHHIAWRTKNKNEQSEWRRKVIDFDLHSTQIIDRQYFNSIYFREPGGVLFEIATDEPGFLIDEKIEDLGKSLKLPPQHEEQRKMIESVLPELVQK